MQRQKRFRAFIFEDEGSPNYGYFEKVNSGNKRVILSIAHKDGKICLQKRFEKKEADELVRWLKSAYGIR